MTEELKTTNLFDEEEIHTNCIVQIWKNSTTGEVSIGWWENNIEKKGQQDGYSDSD